MVNKDIHIGAGSSAQWLQQPFFVLVYYAVSSRAVQLDRTRRLFSSKLVSLFVEKKAAHARNRLPSKRQHKIKAKK